MKDGKMPDQPGIGAICPFCGNRSPYPDLISPKAQPTVPGSEA